MRKKHKTVSATAIRLSSYEKYSTERMDTIIKRLDDLTVEVKDLRTDVSMGKGVIAFLVIIGSIAGSINYDVKTVSYRKSNTKYAHKKNDRINRSPSKIQKDMNVKIVYVYDDGRVIIK